MWNFFKSVLHSFKTVLLFGSVGSSTREKLKKEEKIIMARRFNEMVGYIKKYSDEVGDVDYVFLLGYICEFLNSKIFDIYEYDEKLLSGFTRIIITLSSYFKSHLEKREIFLKNEFIFNKVVSVLFKQIEEYYNNYNKKNNIKRKNLVINCMDLLSYISYIGFKEKSKFNVFNAESYRRNKLLMDFFEKLQKEEEKKMKEKSDELDDIRNMICYCCIIYSFMNGFKETNLNIFIFSCLDAYCQGDLPVSVDLSGLLTIISKYIK
jgi:hypothetical protein